MTQTPSVVLHHLHPHLRPHHVLAAHSRTRTSGDGPATEPIAGADWHAYLLTGQAGIGKHTFAVELARAPATEAPLPRGRPCAGRLQPLPGLHPDWGWQPSRLLPRRPSAGERRPSSPRRPDARTLSGVQLSNRLPADVARSFSSTASTISTRNRPTAFSRPWRSLHLAPSCCSSAAPLIGSCRLSCRVARCSALPRSPTNWSRNCCRRPGGRGRRAASRPSGVTQ